jgi:hypothetical protein
MKKKEKTKLPIMDFMIDLETMGDKPDAVIASIAVTAFEIRTGKILGEFYEKVDMQDCIDLGMTISVGTIKWWLKQSLKARKEILIDIKPLRSVLTHLSMFIESYTTESNPFALRKSVRKSSQYTKSEIAIALEARTIKTHEVALWSNPKEFDIPILQNAYEKTKISISWNWRYDKYCVKEICRMAPNVKSTWKYEGVAHNAKIDNKNQITYLCETIKKNPAIYVEFLHNH